MRVISWHVICRSARLGAWKNNASWNFVRSHLLFRTIEQKVAWQLSDLSTALFKIPKRCSQTKLMDSTDIFNKHAVNCELSEAKVLYPYMAKHRPQQMVIRWSRPVSGRRHVRSSSGSGSNSQHYGRPANSVSYRSGDNHGRRDSSCSSSGNSSDCSGSGSCSSRSVISSWSRDHNVQLAPNNCLWHKRRPNSLTNTDQQHHNKAYTA